MNNVLAPEDLSWLEDKGAFGRQVIGPVAKSKINTRATTHKRKLKKKIVYAWKLFKAPDAALETFLTARYQIDILKEKLVDAHKIYDSLLETKSGKEASYCRFDFKDREFTDSTTLERSSYRSESPSHSSDHGQLTKNKYQKFSKILPTLRFASSSQCCD